MVKAGYIFLVGVLYIYSCLSRDLWVLGLFLDGDPLGVVVLLDEAPVPIDDFCHSINDNGVFYLEAFVTFCVLKEFGQ